MIGYYKCEVCRKVYTKPKLAEACEAQVVQPLWQPEQIVTCSPCYGWYDGDPAWISNMATKGRGCEYPGSNCFGPCCNYLFYWVITAITISQDDLYAFSHPLNKIVEHSWLYHLATRAIVHAHGYSGGWTRPDGHFTPSLVSSPPQLDTTGLIGREFKHLL